MELSPQKLGEDGSNLTSISFFRWVGEKPPTRWGSTLMALAA